MRGLSYLLSVVLVTLVVVALAVGLYAYFHGWLGAEIGAAKSDNHYITIDAGYISESTNSVVMWVRNHGVENVSNLRVYTEKNGILSSPTEVSVMIKPSTSERVMSLIKSFDVKPGERYTVYVYGSGTFTTLQAIADPWLMVIDILNSNNEYLIDETYDNSGYLYVLGVINISNNWLPITVKIDPVSKSIQWAVSYNISSTSFPIFKGLGNLELTPYEFIVFPFSSGSTVVYLVVVDPDTGDPVGAWTIDYTIPINSTDIYVDGNDIYLVGLSQPDGVALVSRFTVIRFLWYVILQHQWTIEIPMSVDYFYDIYFDGSDIYVAVNDTVIIIDSTGNIVGGFKVDFPISDVYSSNGYVYISGIRNDNAVISKIDPGTLSIIWSKEVDSVTSPGFTIYPLHIEEIGSSTVVYLSELPVFVYDASTGSWSNVRNGVISILTLNDTNGDFVSINKINITGYDLVQYPVYDSKTTAMIKKTSPYGGYQSVVYEVGNDFSGMLTWTTSATIPNPVVEPENDVKVSDAVISISSFSATPSSISPSISSTSVSTSAISYTVLVATG